VQLELVVDEPRSRHRLDDRCHLLPVAKDMGRERPEGIRIGTDRGDLHRLTALIKDVHIEPLAR